MVDVDIEDHRSVGARSTTGKRSVRRIEALPREVYAGNSQQGGLSHALQTDRHIDADQLYRSPGRHRNGRAGREHTEIERHIADPRQGG